MYNFYYVLVGDRDLALCRESIQALRSHRAEVEVVVYSDFETTIAGAKVVPYQRRQFSRREGHRNSSHQRLVALLNRESEVAAYLDNDVVIVNDGFFDGFELAANHGLCLPHNPRSFLRAEMALGTDIPANVLERLRELPAHQPAYNMGVMFAGPRGDEVLTAALELQTASPGRGQTNLALACWSQKFTPLGLPVNWLVCGEHTGISDPLALHLGHKSVRQWYDRSWLNWPLVEPP